MPRIPVKRYARYVGIDPGMAGGIAVLSWVRTDSPILYTMPETTKDIWSLLEGFTIQGWQPIIVMIERVWARPGQSAPAMWKFGVGYGGLLMALTGNKLSFEEVLPQTWMKAFGIKSKQRNETHTKYKNRIKAKAQQLFPNSNITLKTADALLITEFCRRTFERS